jgi:hypothetical protein
LGSVQGPDEFLDLRPPDCPVGRVPLGLLAATSVSRVLARDTDQRGRS